MPLVAEPGQYRLLRAADRYAYTGCGSTAYSMETVYGGERHLYPPDARPALLATPHRLTGDALPRLTGDALSLHRRRPARPARLTPKRGLLTTQILKLFHECSQSPIRDDAMGQAWK